MHTQNQQTEHRKQAQNIRPRQHKIDTPEIRLKINKQTNKPTIRAGWKWVKYRKNRQFLLLVVVCVNKCTNINWDFFLLKTKYIQSLGSEAATIAKCVTRQKHKPSKKKKQAKPYIWTEPSKQTQTITHTYTKNYGFVCVTMYLDAHCIVCTFLLTTDRLHLTFSRIRHTHTQHKITNNVHNVALCLMVKVAWCLLSYLCIKTIRSLQICAFSGTSIYAMHFKWMNACARIFSSAYMQNIGYHCYRSVFNCIFLSLIKCERNAPSNHNK